MHDEVYRHFLWFEVAYIDNPDTVNARLVCQIQLLANLGCSCCVYPSVVPGSTVHVNVVVHAHASFACLFLLWSCATDVSPVVVAEKQGDIIRNCETSIVIALHLGEDGPQLRNL